MTKLNIDTISMLPRGMLNAFLVTWEADAVLIDTGLPNSVPKIARALARRNMGWGNLRLIVLTHGRVCAGDLAASGIALGGLILRGRPKSPPFEEDRAAVATSLDRLLALGGREFLLGHGGPLPASAIKSHIANLT